MTANMSIIFIADTSAIGVEQMAPEFSIQSNVQYNFLLTRCAVQLEVLWQIEGFFLLEMFKKSTSGLKFLIQDGMVPFISLMREIFNLSGVSVYHRNLNELKTNREKFVLLYLVQTSFQSRNLSEAKFQDEGNSFNLKEIKAKPEFEQIVNQMVTLKTCLKNLNLGPDDNQAWIVLVNSIKQLDSGAFDMQPYYKTELETFASTLQQMIETLFKYESEWSEHWPKQK